MSPHSRRHLQRGFTLVELMIIVLIIGVLSTMAAEGYRYQIARSKTAEPRAMLGAIRRGVSIAADQEWTKSEILTFGQASTNEGSADKVTGGGSDSTSGGSGKGKGNGNGNGSNGGGATVEHGVSTILCNSADPVPSDFTKVQKKRYQSMASEWAAGDKFTGWRCLGFSIGGPQYYQYGYDFGGPKIKVTLPGGGSPPGLDQNLMYTGWARGDLDGDGRMSYFVIEGALIDGTIHHSTGIGIIDEVE